MNKKYFAFGILFLAMLLLVSCSGGDGGGAVKEVNYFVGNPDVEVEFLSSDTFYQERPLVLRMNLHNKLAYQINEVYLMVRGLDKTYVDLNQNTLQLGSIEGRNKFLPEGELKELIFQGGIKSLPFGASHEILENYVVVVGYLSTMRFSDEVCISPNLYVGAATGKCIDTNKKNNLDYNQKLSFQGQGAPLTVSEMEVISGINSDVELRIKLRNQGRGNLFGVNLDNAQMSGKDLNCEFREFDGDKKKFYFTKKKTEANLICNIVLPQRSTAYPSPVVLEFTYDYELEFKKNLKLRK